MDVEKLHNEVLRAFNDSCVIATRQYSGRGFRPAEAVEGTCGPLRSPAGGDNDGNVGGRNHRHALGGKAATQCAPRRRTTEGNVRTMIEKSSPTECPVT